MTAATLHRLAAFSHDPKGGNPAGVWIGDALPDPAEMQAIAAEVGYSETIFLAPATGRAREVRYYSPEAEVSFCGHATIAAGVALGETDGPGRYLLSTTVGEVPVEVGSDEGRLRAELTSVAPRHEPLPDALLDETLALLGWRRDELDPTIPPAKAYAGAWHLLLAAADARRLETLDYSFETLKALMLREGLTTVSLLCRVDERSWLARNPFPVGGVVEDPATGAAAAALGGYLRDAGLVEAPATVHVRQGEQMGRPSLLTVRIPAAGGIAVSGTAVRL